jgi:hypothetical protein
MPRANFPEVRVMRAAAALGGIAALVCVAATAVAQVTPPASAPSTQTPLQRLFAPATPRLDLSVFGGGFASQDYYDTDEGIQIEQGLTQGLGLVARATGYQLFLETNAVSPLQSSSSQTEARLNFGRFEAGLDISPFEGTNLYLLGGHDIGDSDAFVVEGDLSTWLFQSSAHPVNLFVTPTYDTENKITSSEIDLRVVATRTPDWTILAGAGGAVYGGGFIHGVDGQGGPILGVYNSNWRFGADVQAGYGSPGAYGELTLYKTFSLWE